MILHFIVSERSNDGYAYAESCLLEDNPRPYGGHWMVQRELLDGPRVGMGEEPRLRFLDEIVQGVDIFEIIPIVVRIFTSRLTLSLK